MLNKYYKYLPWLIWEQLALINQPLTMRELHLMCFIWLQSFWLFISLCYFYMRTISSIDTRTSLLTCWVILRKIAIPKNSRNSKTISWWYIKRSGTLSRPRFLFQSIGFSWFLFRYSFEPDLFYVLAIFYEKVIADDWTTGVDEIDQFSPFVDSELLL